MQAHDSFCCPEVFPGCLGDGWRSGSGSQSGICDTAELRVVVPRMKMVRLFQVLPALRG